MIIQAPAKVNLHLAVLDKRPDGFHNIESLFVALDFGDILHFEPKTDGENAIDLIMQGPAAPGLEAAGGLPIEKNIIFKALSLFKEKSLSKGKDVFPAGLKILVEKHIPAGGGLGGGSSNAASTLLALNQLAGCPLERAELLEIGAALGSDVPFFLHEVPAAWVTGRGEHIEPLEPPSWHFVLVNPGFHSDTGTAFNLLEQYRKGAGVRGQGSEFSSDNLSFLYQSKIVNNEPQPLTPNPYSLFKNDFLAVFSEPEKSTYCQIIQQILSLGAEFAGLSGSGSTCFGAFCGKEQADSAALSLRGEWEFTQSSSVKKFC